LGSNKEKKGDERRNEKFSSLKGTILSTYIVFEIDAAIHFLLNTKTVPFHLHVSLVSSVFRYSNSQFNEITIVGAKLEMGMFEKVFLSLFDN